MKLSMRCKYITRAGEPVRVLCVDGPDPAGPIIGILPSRRGASQWTASGKPSGAEHYLNPSYNSTDIMTVSEYRQGRTVKIGYKQIPMRLRKGERP